MSQVFCTDCKVEFAASRSDAKRCCDCKMAYRRMRDGAPERKLRRAIRHKEIRQKLFAGYGGACSCCGEKRFEFLALDHVDGGGRNERKTLSTAQIARRAVNEGFPAKYRVLCHNCNQSHGWYGYCPHDKEKA